MKEKDDQLFLLAFAAVLVFVIMSFAAGFSLHKQGIDACVAPERQDRLPL
jgi:hypothetical protein